MAWRRFGNPPRVSRYAAARVVAAVSRPGWSSALAGRGAFGLAVPVSVWVPLIDLSLPICLDMTRRNLGQLLVTPSSPGYWRIQDA
jgi:hypothetical protein